MGRLDLPDVYRDENTTPRVSRWERLPRTTPELPSPRELEVLEAMSYGHTNASIAAGLGLSIETVKSHVRHLLGKLDAHSRAHAVAVAIRNGLIT